MTLPHFEMIANEPKIIEYYLEQLDVSVQPILLLIMTNYIISRCIVHHKVIHGILLAIQFHIYSIKKQHVNNGVIALIQQIIPNMVDQI